MEFFDRVATVNPYAVAEQMAGKPITWAAYADPDEALAQVFHMPVKAIFDADSPILIPDYVRLRNGRTVLLDIAAGRKRLQDYMSQQPCGAAVSEDTDLAPQKSVMDVLFPSEPEPKD